MWGLESKVMQRANAAKDAGNQQLIVDLCYPSSARFGVIKQDIAQKLAWSSDEPNMSFAGFLCWFVSNGSLQDLEADGAGFNVVIGDAILRFEPRKMLVDAYGTFVLPDRDVDVPVKLALIEVASRGDIDSATECRRR